MSEFAKAGDLVLLQNCVSTLLTAKACWQLPKRRQFVRCKKDSACFQDEIPPLVNVYRK